MKQKKKQTERKHIGNLQEFLWAYRNAVWQDKKGVNKQVI